MALAKGVGERPFILSYREVIRRKKKGPWNAAGGMGWELGEDEKWLREGCRAVCVASGIRRR